MSRINVTDPETGGLAGWFDGENAKRYPEATRWDGCNNVSVVTGNPYNHQALMRTAQGRWVRNTWSAWQGAYETHEFITPEEARDWLLLNEYSTQTIAAVTAVAVPDESGPSPQPDPVFQVVELTADQAAGLAAELLAGRGGRVRIGIEEGVVKVDAGYGWTLGWERLT